MWQFHIVISSVQVMLMYQAAYWGVGGSIGGVLSGLLYSTLGWSALCVGLGAVAISAAAVLTLLEK